MQTIHMRTHQRFVAMALSLALFVSLIVAVDPKKIPLAHATPPAAGPLNTHDPVLFIHGFSFTPVDCQTYGWNTVEGYVKARHTLDGYPVTWNPGGLETIGYYKGDSTCDINLNYSTDTAALVAQRKCTSYFSRDVGTTSESIKHLGCELAWFIYIAYEVGGDSRFHCPVGMSTPCNVQIVTHSMGGLITRWALAQAGTDRNFPPSPLYVHDVLDFSTPNGGLSRLEAASVMSLCLVEEWGQYCNQVAQMLATHNLQEEKHTGSVMYDMAIQAGYSQGAQGTNWTLIGTETPLGSLSLGNCVFDIAPQEATAMNAGYKIWYLKPCYNHGVLSGTMLQDTSDGLDAKVRYCDGCSGVVTQTAVGYPRPLLRMLYALTELPVPLDEPMDGLQT